jgi:hypothetical protein
VLIEPQNLAALRDVLVARIAERVFGHDGELVFEVLALIRVGLPQLQRAVLELGVGGVRFGSRVDDRM